jgi:hypothetical protein
LSSNDFSGYFGRSFLAGSERVERGLFRSASTPEFADYLLHKTQFER